MTKEELSFVAVFTADDGYCLDLMKHYARHHKMELPEINGLTFRRECIKRLQEVSG
jgi:hypothetical protein